MNTTPLKLLIDPTAAVLNREASTRSLRLIHRALLSHLVTLNTTRVSFQRNLFVDEPFDVEYDSTSQLCQDLEDYLKLRQNA